MLLGADGHGVDVVETAGRGRRLVEGSFPLARVDLGAGRVRCLPATYE